MNKFAKVFTGVAAAALVTVTAAVPAQARDRYDRDGIDVGDVITGVAIVGGIAAVAGALSNNRGGYGYTSGRYGSYGSPYGYGTPYGYGSSYGYGNSYGSPYGYGGGYGLNRGYGAEAAVSACGFEAQRYGAGNVRIVDVDRKGSRSFRVRGIFDGGYNRGYGFDRYGSQRGFSCTARADGRVTDFDTNRARF